MACLTQEALNVLHLLLLEVELGSKYRHPKPPPPGMCPFLALQLYKAPKRTNAEVYLAIVKRHKDSRACFSCRDKRVLVGLLILREDLHLA